MLVNTGKAYGVLKKKSTLGALLQALELYPLSLYFQRKFRFYYCFIICSQISSEDEKILTL